VLAGHFLLKAGEADAMLKFRVKQFLQLDYANLLMVA
jgi:hypothetical protein